MVTPDARREMVEYWKANHQFSERRACRMIHLQRSTHRYQGRPDRDVNLRAELRRLAKKHLKYGSLRLYQLLRRRGWRINHKRVERLYREERLKFRRRSRKKRPATLRIGLMEPQRANQHWAMDFVHDALFNGRRFRCLTVIDLKTRVSPLIYPAHSISGQEVARVLDGVLAQRGKPEVITVDNGPEFRSREMQRWAQKHGIELNFIEPGKPTQNAFIESFNGKFRDECLNQHWFTSLHEAKEIIENWREEYNTFRPHHSLKGQTPCEYENQLTNGYNQQMNLLPTGT